VTAILVALAAMVMVAAASAYVAVTVRRNLSRIEDQSGAAWSGLKAELDHLRAGAQRRFNIVDRALTTAREAHQRREEELATDLRATRARLADLVTFVEYGERAVAHGHPRHTFPGMIKVDGEGRRPAIDSLEKYLTSLGATSLFATDKSAPWRREFRLAYRDGYGRLRARLGEDVYQAETQRSGPINELLRAVGRETAGSLQLGPLVVVRAGGQFHAALVVEESDMDAFDERNVLGRPDVALESLRRPPPAHHFDLSALLDPEPPDPDP